jgi:hypothetical protein
MTVPEGMSGFFGFTVTSRVDGPSTGPMDSRGTTPMRTRSSSTYAPAKHILFRMKSIWSGPTNGTTRGFPSARVTSRFFLLSASSPILSRAFVGAPGQSRFAERRGGASRTILLAYFFSNSL